VTLDADKVRQFQRAVGANPDGVFGPATLNLGLAYIAAHGGTEAPVPATPAQPPTGLADPRSEGILATLHPQVQQPFRDLLRQINAAVAPDVGKWISGYRGKVEQNQAVANGASNAPWPHSAHNGGGGKAGFACDIGFFSAGGKYIDEGPQYDIAGKLARAAGFNWGADFGDRPHICLRPPSLRAMSETAFINALIKRVQNGLAVWP
jgi:hypothetical protein